MAIWEGTDLWLTDWPHNIIQCHISGPATVSDVASHKPYQLRYSLMMREFLIIHAQSIGIVPHHVEKCNIIQRMLKRHNTKKFNYFTHHCYTLLRNQIFTFPMSLLSWRTIILLFYDSGIVPPMRSYWTTSKCIKQDVVN